MGKRKNRFQKQSLVRKYLNEAGVQIGRFSDRDKTFDQLMALQEADSFIEKGQFVDAFEKFLVFLKNNEDNLSYTRENNSLNFTIYQGSKVLNGFVDKQKIVSKCEMFRIKTDNHELYKKLLELSHSLKFASFYIEGNKVVLKTELFTDKVTTELLYYALREQAVFADKYDDYFEIHFKNVEPINKQHIQALDETIYEVKVRYLKEWIKEALDVIKKYNFTEMSSAISFILMATVFKIATLTVPEGELADFLSEIIKFYYESNKIVNEKNLFVRKKLEELLTKDDVFFKNSFYKVKKTFSENLPVDSSITLNFIKKEYEKIYWYDANGHKDVVKAIMEYIAGYIDYNFSILPVLKDLFLIFWEVLYKEYFNDLGIHKLPYEKNRISYFILARNISAINNIAKEHFTGFAFNVKHLNLENRYSFAKTFLQEIISLDFSTTEKEKV